MFARDSTKSFVMIVEPWFTAVGHPAQSLLNTARALKNHDRTRFLASRPKPEATPLKDIGSMLDRICDMTWFSVPGDSLAVGTLLAVYHLVLRARNESQTRIDVFFLDAHLLVLSVCVPLIRWLAPNIDQIGCLLLWGPERVGSNSMTRRIAQSFILAPQTRLFLRTEELAAAWRSVFSASSPEKIAALPSLEVSRDEVLPSVPAIEGPSRFGLFGQIRPGKGIEWLVPLFAKHPGIGMLRIAGKASDARFGQELAALHTFPGFENRFVSEAELLELASSVDYLLVLYDRWDHRMEAATFYLAARASKPVICYSQGWCGRMVESFGCGVAVPPTHLVGADFFASLPTRDSAAYKKLLAGIGAFRDWVSAPDRVVEFSRAIGSGGDHAALIGTSS